MKKSFFVVVVLFVFLLSFISPGQDKGVRSKIKPPYRGGKIGKQYLVLIAINKYQNWNLIKGPLEDAGKIKEILTSRYHIDDIIELYDEQATKGRIIQLLKELQKSVGKDDSLLIFFSGHGHLDESSNNGFWIPVDGGTDENIQGKWIPNSIIRGLIANMKSKHILLISDSCYSGELIAGFRGGKQGKITNEYLKKTYSRRCRQIMTSGASEKVPAISEFARQLILALEENDRPYIDSSMLFNEIKLGVKKTLPLFGELKETNHQEGAGFLFFLKAGRQEEIPGPTMPKDLFSGRVTRSTISDEEIFGQINSNPFGEKINQKAKKIYKNSKGYWEAEFDYGIVMVYIPEGKFTMGSNDGNNEKPAHEVYLDGYWIGKYEVTFAQYDKYCEKIGEKKPDDEGWGRGQRPIINVSWHDATAFCRWLSEKTGLGFKLPTEAQWEKAARGTGELIYPWGFWFDKNKCNSSESGLKRTEPVGGYPGGASPYGCLNMAGNVCEWCSDRYDEKYYKSSPGKNPQGPDPESGSPRVMRGGSWEYDADLCRATFRVAPAYLGARIDDLGFRLALSSSL
ncbi:MAG: SUMF1/EgtB/PvdO family nonheme iron enzyme [Candidatus Aminicenantes bacterium]|nr:SUMF1/EgtB/PvdO family nonheme iron enzyme [Candidatus Aminicenantes bacterium]